MPLRLRHLSPSGDLSIFLSRFIASHGHAGNLIDRNHAATRKGCPFPMRELPYTKHNLNTS